VRRVRNGAQHFRDGRLLRAADAFNAVRHGGPHRLEQNLSATFFFAWRTHPQKICPGKLLRGFCFDGIFDFFTKIDPEPTSLLCVVHLPPRSVLSAEFA
jgi:hypothetical protein